MEEQEAKRLELLGRVFDLPVAEYICSILETQDNWATDELMELMCPFQDGGDADASSLEELCAKLTLTAVIDSAGDSSGGAGSDGETMFKEGEPCRVLSVGGTHEMGWHDATIKSIRIVPPNIRLFQVALSVSMWLQCVLIRVYAGGFYRPSTPSR